MQRLDRYRNNPKCYWCETTEGKFVNACISPTSWAWSRPQKDNAKDSRLLQLIGESPDDYVVACIKCSHAYDQRVRNEALAAYFGIPLPDEEVE